jgi:hypothetical protein
MSCPQFDLQSEPCARQYEGSTNTTKTENTGNFG